MDLTALFLADYQRPLYLIPLGSYFSVDFPTHNYSDIIQKNHECDESDDFYVGYNINYLLSAKSLVTLVPYKDIK